MATNNTIAAADMEKRTSMHEIEHQDVDKLGETRVHLTEEQVSRVLVDCLRFDRY